ncbi:hypothetical protein HOY80DRAFT_1136956 [Tuber brumale]|nr:hypothetical protein HOY80DRAFT_1136956 [Tuber brumale]
MTRTQGPDVFCGKSPHIRERKINFYNDYDSQYRGNTWKESRSPPPPSSALRTSPIVTPATLQKLVAQSPRKPKKRHNRSASNSEVLADQAHLGTLRRLLDLVHGMRQHAEICTAKLEQLSQDFDETNSDFAEFNCWQERDRIVLGEIASKSGHEEVIQGQSTPSAKWFHDAEEYETGGGQAKMWGQQ